MPQARQPILDAIAITLYDIVAATGGGDDRQRVLQSVNLRPSDLHMRPGSQEPVSGKEATVQMRAQADSY